MELSSEQINQASVLERNMRESEQNLEFIDAQIAEMTAFSSALKNFSSADKETIFASVGRGVYADAQLTNKKLLVEIGKGILIRKAPEEVREIVDGQVKKLAETRLFLQNQFDFYLSSLHGLIDTIESGKKN